MRRAMLTAREEETREERETSLFARIANFTSLVSLARVHQLSRTLYF